MSLNQLQTTVTAKVWQSIAQSGVDVSGLPREEMNKLVDLVVDAALEAVDDELDQLKQAAPPTEGDATSFPASEDDDDPEQLLWEGRPLLSISVRYLITNERIRIIEGIFGKDYKDIELVRVQHFDFKQSMTERALSVGDLHILSHDRHNPEVTLENIKNPKDVHEILRRAVIKAREKYRLSYREEM